MSTEPLLAFIARELEAPIPSAVADFAAEIAARGGTGVVSVLYYGSSLRTGATDGLLDFYVLLDDLSDWDWGIVARFGARILPPNVEYAETTVSGMTLRAKIAIMSLEQFRRHARNRSYDTTIWARFAQPCALAFVRDDAAYEATVRAVGVAVASAVWWAAHIGPYSGRPDTFWRALFAQTYASELRVEGANRSGSIIDAAPERYSEIFMLALAANRIGFVDNGDEYALAVRDEARENAERAWLRRKAAAKPLNLLRLAKAAFTFSGGVDYIAWKIERHSGHKIEVTPFQRRHPLLAAGPTLWRLWRQGVLR